MIIKTLFAVMSVYLICGLAFAVAFSLRGVHRIDPHGAHGSWGFKVLIIPGAAALWPLLLKRWMTGIDSPPTERTAHRLAAVSSVGERRLP